MFGSQGFDMGITGLLVVLFSVLSPLYAEDLLLIRPDEANFAMARDGLLFELDQELTLHDWTISENTSPAELETILNRVQPKMLVLMEGKAVNLYKKYQESQTTANAFLPCLVLMTAYAKQRISELKNATGILYEIPAAPTLGFVRTLVDTPMERVGVVYSSNLREFYRSQKASAAIEKIELVGIQVDHQSKRLEAVIRRALRRLIKEEKVDAVWIFNDNTILKDVLFEWAWVPQLKRFKKPVVVSLERLLDPHKLGHFAVVPDHFGLGGQAGRMIFSIMDQGWSIDGFAVREPYTALKKVDTRLVPKGVILKQNILVEEGWVDLGARL